MRIIILRIDFNDNTSLKIKLELDKSINKI